jgi:hypothetical protein
MEQKEEEAKVDFFYQQEQGNIKPTGDPPPKEETRLRREHLSEYGQNNEEINPEQGGDLEKHLTRSMVAQKHQLQEYQEAEAGRKRTGALPKAVGRFLSRSKHGDAAINSR